MQSIIHTYKPTWTDCQQLLLTLFNTKEQCSITAALKWLEDHAPADILNAQAYAQAQFLKEDPHWDPNDNQCYHWIE
jgi:hypothetical protein